MILVDVLLSRSFGRRREEIARFRGATATPLSAGTLVAFTALQMQLFPPIYTLLQMTVQVQSSLALFERIFEYLDLPHDIIDAPGAIAPPPQRARGAISLRNVSFRYPAGNGSGPGRYALTDLTLDIEPGQLAAVIGASGSGKTTLSYLLTRLYDVTEGAVLIDGLDVRQIRLDSLAATIGMVTRRPTCSTPRSGTNCATVTRTPLTSHLRPPPAPPRSTIGSCNSTTATTPPSASVATGCPVVKSSGWRSPG